MKAIQIGLEGAYLLEPQIFRDNRGVFSRLFCKKEFSAIGLKKNLVQINYSLTHHKGALRGMHFQMPPHSEFKIVKCLKGSAYDVIVDLRKNSNTLLKWHAETLSEENMRMIFIPEGFAHGFQALEADTTLLYLHTDFYSPEAESAIRFDEPLVDIEWPLLVTEISQKDKSHPLLPSSFDGYAF